MIRIDDVDKYKKIFGEVSRYAAQRSPMESRKCMLIDAKNGAIEISACDGFKTCLRTESLAGELCVLVDAQTISRVFDNFDQPVELSESKNGLRIKSGPTLMTISCRDTSTVDHQFSDEGVSLSTNAHEFADMLSFGMGTARVENGGGEKAVQIIPKFGVVATDSFIGNSGCNILTHIKDGRFSVFEDDRICLKMDHIKGAISTLKSMGTEDEVVITVSKPHLTLDIPGTKICIRRLEEGLVGKVPPRVLEDSTDRSSSFMIAGDALQRILKLMVAVSLPEKKMIRLFDDNGNLGVNQVATESGSSEHSIDGMCDISHEIFLDMDRLSVGISCFGRSESIMATFNEGAIQLAVDNKKVLIAGMQG